MITNLIKKIDIYGSKVDLNFKKRDAYKTVFGGIITLIIYFMFALGCWFFGKELILKEKPVVINQIRTVQQPEKVSFKSDQLIFTLGIQANGQVFNDPTIFSIKGYQENLIYEEDPISPGKITKKIVRYPRELEICQPDNIKIDELKGYFLEKAELSKTYCFKNEQQEEIFMEGDYDSEKFSEVYVFVEKCQNSTSSLIICKPIEEINQILQESIVTMYLSDKIVNPTDYEHPFQNKGINLYALTSSSIQKEIQLYFSNFYIETDHGILYEQIEHQKSFLFAEMKESLIQYNPNLLVRVLLRMQKQKEYLMQRRYQKLADVIALIGGFLKLLTTFGSLLSYPFAKLYLRKAIVDEVFNFEFNQSKASKVKKILSNKNTADQIDSTDQKKIKDVIEMSSIFLKENNESMMQKSSMKISQLRKPLEKEISMHKKQQSILEGIKNIFTITKQNIKYKFINFFGHILFPTCNLKRKLVEKSVQKILEKLDVLYILNKLLEVDKLKHLLLNRDQLNLFEFIPRPVISEKEDEMLSDNLGLLEETSPFQKTRNVGRNSCYLQEKKQKKICYFQGYADEKEETKKALDAYQSLLNILKKKSPSDIDDTLIKLIDPKIVNPFYTCFPNQEIIELNKSNVSIKSSCNNDLIIEDNLNNSFKQNSIFISKPSPFMNENNYFQKKKFSLQESIEVDQQFKENMILKKNDSYQ